jgi:hypothetical protein
MPHPISGQKNHRLSGDTIILIENRIRFTTAYTVR